MNASAEQLMTGHDRSSISTYSAFIDETQLKFSYKQRRNAKKLTMQIVLCRQPLVGTADRSQRHKL